MRKNIFRVLKENKSLLLFISLMLVFRSAVADWNDVPTGSMKPTIVEGDRILINKMAYDLRLPFSQYSLVKLADPLPNDIVIFESAAADKRLVKRVIGVPGDTVSLHKNKLHINQDSADYKVIAEHDGFALSEEKIAGDSHLIRTQVKPGHSKNYQLESFQAVTIPKGYYLVMGDNRDNSADSRVIGLVPRNEIIGRSNTVAFSLNYENYLIPRSERFFKSI
ncbi:signal peptidase I [Colwellia sp. BRX10-3]|uniref:signal peptidase I n=1 Tax=Colwellia sp. BRX10-3 TaxID=2759844 RepID=UPI0015F36A23|nr:signal peptidase I [Colwellia sp. BRX10-3]MBA6391675.1 signal peptidase I [Colwellia sp. BRX10-3]